jgi:putative transposase
MCTRQPYSTDLSDGQWAVLENLVPACKPGGRPPKHTPREIVNAILCVLRASCASTLMPHDLPNGKTAYHCLRAWRIDVTWQTIHDELRGDLRETVGRERDPSAGTIDSQSFALALSHSVPTWHEPLQWSRKRETAVGGGDPTRERRSPSRRRLAMVSRRVNNYATDYGGV